MNKKGYVTPVLALAIMLSTLGFLAVFYTNVARNNVTIQTETNRMTTFIERRTALERLPGVFTKDFDRTAPITYPDNPLEITIQEQARSAQTRQVTLTVTDTRTKQHVQTLNATLSQFAPEAPVRLTLTKTPTRPLGGDSH